MRTAVGPTVAPRESALYDAQGLIGRATQTWRCACDRREPFSRMPEALQPSRLAVVEGRASPDSFGATGSQVRDFRPVDEMIQSTEGSPRGFGTSAAGCYRIGSCHPVRGADALADRRSKRPSRTRLAFAVARPGLGPEPPPGSITSMTSRHECLGGDKSS